MSKKNVLVVSAVYFLYFCGVFVLDFFCDSSLCRIYDDSIFGRIFFSLMPLGLVFIFSLITYKLPDQVFRAWWGFAAWFVPIIIILTTFADTYLAGGGGWGIPDMTEAFVHIPLYVLFVGVSIARIYIAWHETKTGQQMSLIKKIFITAITPILAGGILWIIASSI